MHNAFVSKKSVSLLSIFYLLLFSTFAQMNTASPLRVGIAGLTHAHVHWILDRASDSDIEIVGIAEPNQDLARRLLDQYDLPMNLLYASLEEMLDKVQPEAVTAFNSIFGHLEVVEQCAPRGIHVMVEKPLAVSYEHAKRMAALARRHGIHLLTNYETTWYGSNHGLYDLFINEGFYGTIRKMVVHDGHPGPIEIGCNPEFLEWLTDPIQNGGGALTDFGCYGANLITWLMQNEAPESVTAITQQHKPDKYPKVDDEATIIVTYPGAQGIIQASWNWPTNRKDLHVYGQTGYIKTIDGSQMLIRENEEKPEELHTAAPRQQPLHDPFAYLRAVIRGEIDAGGGLSSIENNLIVMRILDAARRSAKEGKTIRLR